MSRTTIKKYLMMHDIKKESAFDASTRSSDFDQFKDIILDSCGEIHFSVIHDLKMLYYI